ncbi:two component system response regulator [Cupriavidus sp. AU9028]|uniref:two component system response regulator n=1 Tax=Cupriavidus sp. AU9028 TaxID=2871157 RepID=UPI001C958CCC|nr:two component system response regulator [Cupriavidus sp. AU9028]MBY4897897.1 two component system response regulator [Cupriavidus sp. AU9028]
MTIQLSSLSVQPSLAQPARRPVPQSNLTRVVLVDDHTVMREGLRALLGKDPSVDVIGEAADGHAAVQACLRLRPDVVLMDLQLPSLDGVDAIATIRRRWPDIRVVVLAGLHSETRAAAALRAGAHAYVLKRSSLDQLMAALRAARINQPYLDPAMNVGQIDAMRRAANEGGESRAAGLTPRERQILKLVAEGLTNRQVADRLTISLKTVETHRMNLMRKLDAHNAAALSQWARRLGLIEI